MSKSIEVKEEKEEEKEEIVPSPPCIIVHGGIEDETASHALLVDKVASCKKSACVGYKKMQDGGSARDAVEAALRWLEDDELFNCGYGSVLNKTGDVQMDASIMDGSNLESGSVVAVSGVDHPISIARYILEKTPNAIYCEGAARKRAANAEEVVRVSEDINMISPGATATQTTDDFGKRIYPTNDIVAAENCIEETVGCIAWDGSKLVAGSSSGGLRGKLEGRLGGSGLIGCSVYADERFGCSMTAPGESTITHALARQLATDICSFPDTLEELCEGLIAGAVGLDTKGEFFVHFTCGRMPYCFVGEDCIFCGSELSKCNDVGAE